MASRGYTVYLHNDETGDLDEMHVVARNKKDAENIAASRTSYEWIIDSVQEN